MNVTLEREIEVEFEVHTTGRAERWGATMADSAPSEMEVEIFVQSATILGVELSRDMNGDGALKAVRSLLASLAEETLLEE